MGSRMGMGMLNGNDEAGAMQKEEEPKCDAITQLTGFFPPQEYVCEGEKRRKVVQDRKTGTERKEGRVGCERMKNEKRIGCVWSGGENGTMGMMGPGREE